MGKLGDTNEKQGKKINRCPPSESQNTAPYRLLAITNATYIKYCRRRILFQVLMLVLVTVSMAYASMSARFAYNINTPDATTAFKSAIVPYPAVASFGQVPLLARSMYAPAYQPILTNTAMPAILESPLISRSVATPSLSLSRSSMMLPSLYPTNLAARTSLLPTSLSYPASLQASPLIASAAPGLGMWSGAGIATGSSLGWASPLIR